MVLMLYGRLPRRGRSPRWTVEGVGPVYRLRDAKAMGKAAGGMDGPRFRRQATVGNVRISTVGDWWCGPLGKRLPLGLLGFDDVWYETMAFVDGAPDICRRYLTEAEARAGHDEVVAIYRAMKTVPEDAR